MTDPQAFAQSLEHRLHHLIREFQKAAYRIAVSDTFRMQLLFGNFMLSHSVLRPFGRQTGQNWYLGMKTVQAVCSGAM